MPKKEDDFIETVENKLKMIKRNFGSATTRKYGSKNEPTTKGKNVDLIGDYPFHWRNGRHWRDHIHRDDRC